MQPPDASGYELAEAVTLLEAHGWSVAEVVESSAPNAGAGSGPIRVARVDKTGPRQVRIVTVRQQVLAEPQPGPAATKGTLQLTDKTASADAELAGLEIPRHIAVIMDGNGRWAQQRGLPRINGHFEGQMAAHRCIHACCDLDVRYVSMYAFSTENWSRPTDEVQGLMALIEMALKEEIEELDDRGVCFLASGRLTELPVSLQDTIAACSARTAANTELTLNLTVNYGGRAEIVDAARTLARRAVTGELRPDDIDEQTFASALYHELPDPDVLLRTGGEMRLSNFMLWQVAYAETIVMPVLWPDFQIGHLKEAIVEYNRRQRRFGGVLTEG